ncbi:MAG: gluconate 2-dehydrogenase subunit 3 family protein [Gemmatimonadaceae bacterium]
MSDEQDTPMKRREALKVIATTAASIPLAEGLTPREASARELPMVEDPQAAPLAPASGPRGTVSDPDLQRPVANWPRKLTSAELVTLTALCDMIIPADSKSPSASAVGVPAYVNEYVSCPREYYQKVLVQVRGGLVWLNVESDRRFGRPFARLTNAERTQICDDICYVPRAKPEFQAAARFFDIVRDLTAEGFYTTDAGMKDIGYVGNVALPRFDGPPPEVLKHLGLS